MSLTPKEVLEKIKAQFSTVEVVDAAGDPFAVVPVEKLRDVGRWLKDTPEMEFDYLACVSGVDDKKDFWTVYHLYSIKRNQRATLKVKLNREKPSVPSVCAIWPGANWHEREAYDLFGIVFEEHPDLRRILLPDDWTGHPLRKDYEYPDQYQGIPLK